MYTVKDRMHGIPLQDIPFLHVRVYVGLSRTRYMPEGGNWGNVQICAFFALRSRPFTAPLFDWDHFCSKLKLEL